MMNTAKNRSAVRVLGWSAAAVMVLLAAACGGMMAMMHGGPARPADSEFGLGPRLSTAGTYTVALQPVAPLVTRRLQKVNVRITDADGKAVDGASITVDGGMPQHGHGLPTRPRMTKSHGNGVYEIDGVRFNMGGWWEFKLAIRAQAGADSVTFNLSL